MWSPTSGKPRDVPSDGEPPRSVSPTTPHVARQKNPGRRISQIVKLKPEYLEQYKEVHAHVWPEVLKQIKQCNIEDCESRPPQTDGEGEAVERKLGADGRPQTASATTRARTSCSRR